MGVASFALHDALTVEQELGDVSERGGVASSDAAMDELLQQVSQKQINSGGLRQIFHALQKIGGKGGGVFRGASSGLALADGSGVLLIRVIGAEDRMRSARLQTAAAGLGLVLAASWHCEGSFFWDLGWRGRGSLCNLLMGRELCVISV